MKYRVRELRKEKRWSQGELAEKAGISRGNIARLEKGEDVATTTGTLKKISDALGVPMDSLYLP
ncbi:MAG: helix-turn-helix transcriptional regulator [Lachnospiraceae bacterium]|nr:helix-turn-helix transcriptional regulator [Lachnospiraceae bacterium]MBR4414408.1 helix-turn-helix transcriptional regulator [Aeriscardovia sp.]